MTPMLLRPGLKELTDLAEATSYHQVDVLLTLYRIKVSLLEGPSHLSQQSQYLFVL